MELLTYLLKVSACTALFFGFYLLVLRKLTFFKINRFYLLGSLILSFAIPAMQFTIERDIEQIAAINNLVVAEQPDNLIEESQPTQIAVIPVVNEVSYNWISLTYYGYGFVATLMLLSCIFQVLRLINYTRNYTRKFNDLKLISKTEGFTNCSFFNYVFIDETNLSEADLQILLKHEQIHSNQFHSVDKILLMIAKAVLWFNPIIYLFDKALEQTHEYEADEATSQNFGNNAYASLLLRLAVSKSDMPLIHNFVKSPIKERIKMLFNSKSKNMKKLSYLLTLPVALGLVWVFAVQVVYAQARQNTTVDIQPKATIGEIIRGKVIKVDKIAIGNVFELSSNGKIYLIDANGYSDKIKIGDEVIILISALINNFNVKDKDGKVIKSLDKPVYVLSKITDYDGKLIYERKSEKYAFGYEVNKARYASSKIKLIKKNIDGTLNQIVLNDGIFTINLNLSSQNLKDNNFKVGDEVVVKFIGEQQVAKNTYSTSKMIVLYSQPKQYELKNETLFNRFYQKDGRQKVALLQLDSTQNIIPKIISSSKITGDVKKKISYLENAVIEILGSNIKAKNVELNQKEKILIADHAVITNGGTMVIAEKAVFNLLDGTYRVYESNSEQEKKASFTDFNLKENENMIAKSIHYSALDSIKQTKDKSVISLYGSAKMYFKDVRMEAEEISFNNKTLTGSAKNLVITQLGSGTKIKGANAKFNLNGKVEIWQSSGGNLIVQP